MTKRFLAITLLAVTILLVGCKSVANVQPPVENNQEGAVENNDTSTEAPQSVEEKNENGEFFFMAKVLDTSERDRFIVDILDSKVAFGHYHVLTGEVTSYFDKDGNAITREDIKVGDTVEIIFSGQVMTSNPPKIAAIRIHLI